MYKLSINSLKVGVYVFIIALGLFVIGVPKADADEELSSVRTNYNIRMISTGISMYYGQNFTLPTSISVLLDGGWIPPNLPNPYTGEVIDPYAQSGDYGEYFITVLGTDHIELTWNREDEPVSFEYDPSTLGEQTMGLSDESVWKHHASSWGRYALDAFYRSTGEYPQSINDLQASGFWPYEGMINFYTGELMQFNSQTYGDMTWEFNGNNVEGILWLEPRNGAENSCRIIHYPFQSDL